jgi:cell division protein FtsN
MCFGLAVGLSVAAAIYVSDRQLGSPLQTGSAPPAVPEKPAPAARVEEQETEPDPASRFDFYELLPKFEVVIPEEDLHAHPDVAARPVESPGVYVLQAGSFSGFADADRMKARLALLGIVSRIQKVSIDEKSYHRVRIGPIDSLDQLNTMRQSLREARIEVMVIQVAD